MNAITVAFGTHDSSIEPLTWSARLAQHLEAPLQVLSIVAPVSAEAPPEFFAELDQRRRQDIEQATKNAGAASADVVVLNEHKPLAAIASYVNEHQPTMCVVGTHDSHEPGGLGEGNPAHHLLHHCHVPVAMVGPGAPTLDGGVFVVGVEATGDPSPALQLASTLASATNGTVHAVHAYESLSEDEAERWRQIEADLAGGVAAPLKFFPTAGHPAQVILEHGDAHDAAAIVTGTRGSGGFGGLILGRVPAQLLSHANRPLIVVPHPTARSNT